ncbi:MAG: CPBP family intramembrane metalloprotease [Marinilabiliales bacterium]|nr:CPBP family intramembrane metalloprotease [Marinilabiliales bacterium]
MKKNISYYPTFWQAVNLIVLYTFLQSLIDFPLALYDYQNGTDWLREPLLKMPVFLATTFVILWLGVRFSGLKSFQIFPFRRFQPLMVLAILLALVPLQFYMNLISAGIDKALPPPSWFLELFNRIFQSDYGIWGGIFRVALLAPVVEELIFRGVIFSGFLRNYRPGWAIFFSSLLFALFHLNPWQLGPTFLLGLLLGLVRWRTGSLLASIFTHALHNSMVFLSVYYQRVYEDMEWLRTNDLPNHFLNLMLLGCGILAILHLTREREEAD